MPKHQNVGLHINFLISVLQLQQVRMNLTTLQVILT